MLTVVHKTQSYNEEGLSAEGTNLRPQGFICTGSSCCDLRSCRSLPVMTGRSWEGRCNSGRTLGSCSSTVMSSLLRERGGRDQPNHRVTRGSCNWGCIFFM